MILSVYRKFEILLLALSSWICTLWLWIIHLVPSQEKGTTQYPLKTIRISSGDDFRATLEAQWARNPEQKYVVEFPFRKIHVLPRSYLTDYGWKTDDEISSNIDLRERILGKYTLLGSMTPMEPGDRTHSAVAFIKNYMTKNMTAYFSNVHDEITNALDTQIGSSPTWKGLSAYQFGVDINLEIYERVFVGLDLCRNEDWKAACKGYSTSAIATASKLMGYRWWLRSIIAPFVPEYKNLYRHIRALHAHVAPLHRARLADPRTPASTEDRDFIQWWIDCAPAARREDSYALTVSLIQLNIAGIQSTGMVTMQVLFDLAGRSEYIQDLRDEINQVTREEGTIFLSPSGLSRLVKMDSFLKESQRHVSQNLLSIYRKCVAPLRLKDDTILPTGTYVAVPSIDPEAAPETITRDFDGFRWARLRKLPGNAHKYTTMISTLDSLEFGYGVHACPGRFFAMNSIKALMVGILRRYDLRLPPGERLPGHRYNSILVLVPPKQQRIEFRNRSSL